MYFAGINIAEPVNWRHTVISRDSIISFKNLDNKKRPIRGFVDGVSLGDVKEMEVKQSRVAAVELAFIRGYDIVEKHARLNLPYLKK